MAAKPFKYQRKSSVYSPSAVTMLFKVSQLELLLRGASYLKHTLFG